MDRPNEASEQQKIFKLSVDCFENLFDYLSIVDLDSLAQTCTRMQRVVGHFYQQELPKHEYDVDCQYIRLYK